jgi:hypothetical protein
MLFAHRLDLRFDLGRGPLWLLRRLAAMYARMQRLDAWLDFGENGTAEPNIPMD